MLSQRLCVGFRQHAVQDKQLVHAENKSPVPVEAQISVVADGERADGVAAARKRGVEPIPVQPLKVQPGGDKPLFAIHADRDVQPAAGRIASCPK